MHLLPSDIARLVLGYLKDKGLKKTLVAFLQESPDLSEYWRVLNSGVMPTTTVMGHTLQSILEEHANLTARVKVLNASLAQYAGAQASHGHRVASSSSTSLDRNDIDAVVESHRKAELSKERKYMRQKARRQSDSQRPKISPRTGASSQVSNASTSSQRIETASSSQASHPQANVPTQVVGGHQAQMHKKDKSSKADDLDDDFEFDSLDRLLADTKLHEKLAESINKALKRDQVVTSDPPTAPVVLSKKKSENQNEEGGGVNIRIEENTQKNTSTVVDDIISMTADGPGLEQLLSLFQFPHETTTKSSSVEDENKSAPLYIPDVESNQMHPHSNLSSNTTVSGHTQSHKGISDALNTDVNVNITDAHPPPVSETTVVTNALELNTTSETVTQQLSTTESAATHPSTSLCHAHTSSKDNFDNMENTQTKESSREISKDVTPTISTSEEHNTPLSDMSSDKEPSSISSTPTISFKKPRVKRCPKRLFKEENHIDHSIQIDKNVSNKDGLMPTGKEHVGSNSVMEPSANLIGASQCTQNLHQSQPTESISLSVARSGDKSTESEKVICRNMDLSENAPHEMNNDECDDSKNRSDDYSEILTDVEMAASPSSIPSPEKCSVTHSPSKHLPSISTKKEMSASCQSNSPSHNASAPPQFTMEENSLSVFSLIDQCTAEIIGETYVPRAKKKYDNAKNEVENMNDAVTKSEFQATASESTGQANGNMSRDAEENEGKFERLHSSVCTKGNEPSQISREKETVNNELIDREVLKQNSTQHTALIPHESLPHDMPEEEDYDSDSSFEGKISTPNAVYVKPVKMSSVTTRERNYQMVDNCLQDILGKIKVSNGEAKSDDSDEVEDQIENDDQHILDSERDKENIGVNIDAHGVEEDEESVEVKLEHNTSEIEPNNLEQRVDKITTSNFLEVEEFHNFSATISTPFITKNVANTDNSPRKLVENHMKNSESVSMPASFPSSLREKRNVNDHHEPNDCCSAFSPSVSKFHPQLKENYSPSMSIPQSSRKVIACNIAHSPFVPSHLKRKGPSRRIIPTEVSFSTPSPLGLMSPSSPAEFIIDLAQSPSQPNTPIRDSKTNHIAQSPSQPSTPVRDSKMKESVKDYDELNEKSQTTIGLKSLKCTDNESSHTLKGATVAEKSVVGEIDGVPPSSAPRIDKPVPSMRDGNTMERSLPSCPSDRKPRRVVPTMLSKTVSKVGSDSLFSSSSCSQNGSMFHQDESKIVSSSSDPASPHSEEQAFRMLKNIFQSYTKPQPNQEITSSNITTNRCLPTPMRKCGCASRDVCTHVTRIRHVSTPMRKCGCASRDVCTHVKGRGRKFFKKHITSFSRKKSKDISRTPKSDNIDIIDLKRSVLRSETDVNSNSSSKDNVNSEENDGPEQATESSQSSFVFVPVGTVDMESNVKPEDGQEFSNKEKANGEKEIDHFDNNVHGRDTIISNYQDAPLDKVKETDTNNFLMTQQLGNAEQIDASNDDRTATENNDSDNSISKNSNGEMGDTKGDSQSSNGSAESVRRSTEFDHHDNISLAAPYFPELSNTFDFFKLKKQNTTETEREHVDAVESGPLGTLMENENPGMARAINQSNNNANEISPMPGTQQVENPLESFQEDHPSSCLISQAMEQCGIPFEPGEQTLMELTRFTQINDRPHENFVVNSDGQEYVSPMSGGHESTRMQLRSASRQYDSMKTHTSENDSTKTCSCTGPRKGGRKKKCPVLPPRQLPLAPAQPKPDLPGAAQPRIILPQQHAAPLQTNVNPSPMTPGSVAFFSRPNLPPVPFTILADGRVIILSDAETQQRTTKNLPTLLPSNTPLQQLHNRPPIPAFMPSVPTPAPMLTSYNRQTPSEHNLLPPPLPHYLPPPLPPSLPPPLMSSVPAPTQILTSDASQPNSDHRSANTNTIINSEISQSSSSNVKKIDSNPSNDSREKRKKKKKKKKKREAEALALKAKSSSVSKAKETDPGPSRNSTEKKKASSCKEPLQKVAQRRKIGEITSSPKKASVSTYFKKPKKSVRRKLSLAKVSRTSISNEEKCDQDVANAEPGTGTQESTDNDKEIESMSLEDEINAAVLGITQEGVCRREEITTSSGIIGYSTEYDNYSGAVISSEVNDLQGEESALNRDGMIAQSQELNDVDSETGRVSDMMALISGHFPPSPEKSKHSNSIQSQKSQETRIQLSPSKHGSNSKETITMKANDISGIQNQKEVSPIQGTVNSCDSLLAENVDVNSAARNVSKENFSPSRKIVDSCNSMKNGNSVVEENTSPTQETVDSCNSVKNGNYDVDENVSPIQKTVDSCDSMKNGNSDVDENVSPTQGADDSCNSVKNGNSVLEENVSPTQKTVDSCNSVHVKNGNGNSEVEEMSEENVPLSKLKSLSQTEKEHTVNVSKDTSEEEKSSLHTKDRGVNKESMSDDFTDITLKDLESSSHETESGGNSCRKRMHSTPVDEEFFDTLELMPVLEDDSGGLHKTKERSVDGGLHKTKERSESSVDGGLHKTKERSERSVGDGKKMEEKTNDFVSPHSSPKKKDINKGKKQNRQSFSDILKSVSLQFKKSMSSPTKKARPPSDDEYFDKGSSTQPRRKRRARYISDSSSNSSNSFSEGVLETNVSYAKLVKDKTVSISVSDDGDVIKNVSGSSISAEESMQKKNRRKQRQHPMGQKEDLRHESRDEIVSPCEKYKEISPIIAEKKLNAASKNEHKTSDVNKEKTSVANGEKKKRPPISKKNQDVREKDISKPQSYRNENDIANAVEKGSRKRKADKNVFEEFDKKRLKPTRENIKLEKKESQTMKDIDKSSKTLNEDPVANKVSNTGAVTADHVKEKGLDLLSSVALGSQNLGPSENGDNLSDVPKAAVHEVKKSTIDDSVVTSKLQKLMPAPSSLSSPVVSNVPVPSSVNDNNSSTSLKGSTSQPLSSPDVSISSTQSAPKSITKKKINKLISKLYKTPPSQPQTPPS